MMKKSLLDKIKSYKYIKLVIIILIPITIWLIYELYIWINTENTDNAYIEADISNVSSEVSGLVEKVFIKENNFVKSGQIIARVDQRDYIAKYKQAQANLQVALRNIEVIEKDIQLAIINYNKSIESSDFAEKSFKKSTRDYNRIMKLNKESYASNQNLDNIKVAYEKEKTDLSQSILDTQISEENIKLLKIKKQIAIANADAELQEYDLAERELEHTNIRAPIDGVVGNSSIREGNYMEPGVVLFAVIPVDKLYIKANYKETQIAHFKEGMVVLIEIDAFPGIKIKGKIRNTSPATGSIFSLLPPANATGNFTKIVQRVPITIDYQLPKNLIDRAVPGMSTLVKIRTNQ